MEITRCFIEISDLCNARCPYCARGMNRVSNDGYISPELFERILARIAEMGYVVKDNSYYPFVWGEPLMHPQINLLMKKIRDVGGKAIISSNLITLPKFDTEALHTIGRMRISLSGFSQDSYKHIHGGNLDKVLRNIDTLVEQIEQAGCDWRPVLTWFRYRYNEGEMAAAREYAASRGIGFQPAVSYIIEFNDSINLLTKPEETLENANVDKDLYLDYFKDGCYENRDPNFICPQWSYLTIDKRANVLLCCNAPSSMMENNGVLGSIFDLEIEDIQKAQKKSAACKVCLESGYAKWIANHSSASLDKYLANKNKKSLTGWFKQMVGSK